MAEGNGGNSTGVVAILVIFVIVDEDGEPVPGATVRVMRYQYLQGDRRLTPAGTGQTDDRGQYRVWGLMPGDYYVNALTRLPNAGGRGFGPPPPGAHEYDAVWMGFHGRHRHGHLADGASQPHHSASSVAPGRWRRFLESRRLCRVNRHPGWR